MSIVRHLTRRDFLKTIGLSTAALVFSGCENTTKLSAGKTAKGRPNVLWIIADDLCPDLGCYGTALVRTPNIDNLASEGARFTNVYSTGTVCSPSRSAFNTGMYATSIGCHQHRTRNKKPLPGNVKVITEYFHSAGYFTSNGNGTPESKPGKNDFNFKVSGKVFDGTDWSQREPGQPFFAEVQFHEPHRTFQRDCQKPINPDSIKIPPYYPDHPVTRRDWADYLETIQILDTKVGKVLKRLEDEGLADNTIVFFFSDQGRPHLRGKQWLYEGGIHIPLIIRWPGHIKPAAVVNDLVSAIDFAPTCLKLVGVEPPGHMQGQVFLGANAKKRECLFAQRDRVDTKADRVRCIRTKRFKYICNFIPDQPYTDGYYKEFQYPVLTLMKVLHKQGKLTPEQASFMASKRPAEELYDLRNDSCELHNLADDHKFRQTLKTLRTKLDKWVKDTGDQGQVPETGVDSPFEVARRRWKKYEPMWRKRGLPRDIAPEKYLKWWEKKLGIKYTENSVQDKNVSSNK